MFRIKWDRIVLDEAHTIRNHTSESAKSVFKLSGSKRWALTGTPVQNKEDDLYALLKFLRVTPFDDLSTFKTYLTTKTQDGRTRLTNLLKPLLLRRTKAELQDKGELQGLPEKIYHDVAVKLSKEEMNVYSLVMAYSRSMFAEFMHQRKHGQEPIDKNKRNEYVGLHQKFIEMHGRNVQIKASQILVLLLRLRQVCNHAGLIHAVSAFFLHLFFRFSTLLLYLQMLDNEELMNEDSTESEVNDDLDIVNQLNNMTLNGLVDNVPGDDDDGAGSKAGVKVLSKHNPVFNFENKSSKVSAVHKQQNVKTIYSRKHFATFQCAKTMEIIEKILDETDEKVVVVSQWTSMLDICANYLRNKRILFTELNGKTPIKSRNDLVQEFNNPDKPKRIMLLSLSAGGVGLNLIGGNHLILIDPHWNPQLESQAFDRVYRVGQKKTVHIYK